MRPNRAYYHLCAICGRAVPATSKELHCINDGERLLESCPRCQTRITSPYAQFCPHCGFEYQKHRLQSEDPELRQSSKPARASSKRKT